jgi:hypothetical protein
LLQVWEQQWRIQDEKSCRWGREKTSPAGGCVSALLLQRCSHCPLVPPFKLATSFARTLHCLHFLCFLLLLNLISPPCLCSVFTRVTHAHSCWISLPLFHSHQVGLLSGNSPLDTWIVSSLSPPISLCLKLLSLGAGASCL